MNTTYKGFTIQHPAAANERFHVVPGAGFNPDGYATINTAKGAITKHLNADGSDATSQPAPKAKAATSDDSERTSTPATVQVVTGWTNQLNQHGDPIHANPATAHVYAQLDYYGMNRERDTRSRAKREGVNPNRKHRSKGA